MSRRSLAALVAASFLALPAFAQSAQRVSLQGSGFYTQIRSGGDAIGGFGVEPQLRVNWLRTATRGVVSVGVGGQWTTHESGGETLTITGVFLEPRWVIPTQSETLYPYLAGRLAVLRQSSNFASASTGNAFGAGGGVVYVLTPRVNVDLGAALVRQQFGEVSLNGGAGRAQFNPFTTIAAKLGVNVGLGK